jgi:deazaflavin-dependent oxidoreductase (nitroreductase family)
MPRKLNSVERPTGFRRLLFRAPIWLYRMGLGGLLGGRFLLLNHIGRKSGLPRQTVLEVAGKNRDTAAYLVASGFGHQSDWYRNILAAPDVTIQVGTAKFRATAVPLSPDDSGCAMVDYAQRHPRAAQQLMNLCGYEVDGSDQDYYRMGHDILPFVALYAEREARSPERS